MSKFPTSTWGQETDANRIKKTYVKGYMDVSGGELSVHNTAFNVFNIDGSGVFRIDPRKITVNDDTGQEVDISLSYLTFLNNLVPADGQAVSIPDKVKYIFTLGTETRIGKSDASSNFRVFGNTYVEQDLFVTGDVSLNKDMDISGSLTVRTHLKLPVGGNDQRPVTVNEAESAGYIRYNIDNSQFEGYGPGDSWGSLGGVINVSQNTKIIASSPDPDSVNNELQFFTAPTGSTIVGDTKERMRILANGDISMNERLFVASDASLNGNLFVAAKTRLGNDLSLNGNFTMYGDASLNGRLMLSGDASLNGNLYVVAKTRLGNDLSLNGNLFVYGGDASLNGRLMLSGDASLNGNLYVVAKTRLGNDLSLNGNLFVYGGDASLNGRLFVSSDTSLNGNLFVNGRTTFYEPSGSVISSGTSRGTLNLTHGDASGGSSILFQSVNSPDNDYAYIQYQENVPYAGEVSTEAGLLTIGIENEITSTHRDRISLWAANGSGNVGVNTKFPNYNLDVSGQMRICEGTGTIASATTGSLMLEHTVVGGTSSIMFKGPNSTTNDYAYIQYEDNTGFTLPVLKYDFSTDVTSTLTTGVPSTGSNTVSITKSGTITSVAVSGLSNPPTQLPAGISCLYLNQTNLISGSGANISYMQTSGNSVNPFNAGGFTFSAWIRPITTGATNCRFYILDISPGGYTSNFSIHFGGGEISALIGNDSTNFTHTTSFTSDIWYHYAFTFDNATSTGIHYINGSLNTGTEYGTGYSGKQLTAIYQNISIGSKFGYNNGEQIGSTGIFAKGFNGYINYVNMFDRALTANEIAVLYNTPTYTQSSVNRGLMTFGIENEPGTVFNDRIALMPANGAGFVGINTKTPTCALDVSGSINATGPLSVSANTTIYDLSYAFSGSSALKGGVLVKNTVGTSRLILGTYFSSPSGVSAIQSSDYLYGVDSAQDLLLNPLGGVVGINTKTPNIFYALDVNGSMIVRGGFYMNNNKSIFAQNTGGTNDFCLMLRSPDTDSKTFLNYGTGGFQIRNNTSNDTMFMTNDNRVGIGTTTPAFKLDVNGNMRIYESSGTTASATTGSLILEHGNVGGVSSIVFKSKGNSGSDYGYIQYYDNFDSSPEYTGNNQDGVAENGMLMIGVENDAGSNTANKDRIVLWSCGGTGYVGINTRRPKYALDVYGDVNAFSYNATSDYRVKTDVKPLDASFNVDVLKPVTYTNTRHGRKDVGFIAHEVQEHYPFLVNGEKDGEQMQSLNYIGLIGILTKEIQDLKRRLAEHEANLFSVENSVLAVGNSVLAVENSVLAVKNNVRSVEDNVRSVEDNVRLVETTVRSVDDHVRLVEDNVRTVETTVLMEQARLAICETGVAFNKSAIKDIEDRFQS